MSGLQGFRVGALRVLGVRVYVWRVVGPGIAGFRGYGFGFSRLEVGGLRVEYSEGFV